MYNYWLLFWVLYVGTACRAPAVVGSLSIAEVTVNLWLFEGALRFLDDALAFCSDALAFCGGALRVWLGYYHAPTFTSGFSVGTLFLFTDTIAIIFKLPSICFKSFSIPWRIEEKSFNSIDGFHNHISLILIIILIIIEPNIGWICQWRKHIYRTDFINRTKLNFFCYILWCIFPEIF